MSIPLQKIFIADSSWGCGVFNDAGTVVHKGLEQFFIDIGYTVINVSAVGSSNVETLQRLDHALDENYRPGDFVFWIKSDPMEHVEINDQLVLQIKQLGSYKNFIKHTSDETYDLVNTLATKFDTTIYAIGGSCNLGKSKLQQLSNVVALVPSWMHLLVAEFPEYTNIESEYRISFINARLVNYIKEFAGDLDFTKNLINELYELLSNDSIYKEDVFCPYYGHPNYHGHQILFNHIVQELKL